MDNNESSIEFFKRIYKEYSEMYSKCSDQELIKSFNSQVGIRCYGFGRMGVLNALQEEMFRRFDVSILHKNGRFSYGIRVILIGKRLEINRITNSYNQN